MHYDHCSDNKSLANIYLSRYVFIVIILNVMKVFVVVFLQNGTNTIQSFDIYIVSLSQNTDAVHINYLYCTVIQIEIHVKIKLFYHHCLIYFLFELITSSYRHVLMGDILQILLYKTFKSIVVHRSCNMSCNGNICSSFGTSRA